MKNRGGHFGPAQVVKLNRPGVVSLTGVSISELVNEKNFPIVNKKGEIQKDSVTMKEADSFRLFYSPDYKAFYSPEISAKIREGFANIESGFYGDEVLDPTRQSHTLNDGNFYLDYFGTADITGDTLVTFADRDSLESIIQNGEYMDEADLNTDGTVDATDLILITEFLTDQKYSLQAYQDLLKTEIERKNSFTDVMDIIDSLDIVSHPGWWCGEYRLSSTIDYNGVSNIENSPFDPLVIDFSRNGRYGRPVYGVNAVNVDGVAHTFNGILLGDSTTSFTDWYFFDNIFGTQVEPGDWSMDPDGFANIERYCYLYSQFVGDTVFGYATIINFDLQGGIAISATLQNPDVVLSRTPIEVHFTGDKPNDTLVNCEIPTHPDSTGWPTNLSTNVMDTIWSVDSTTLAGGVWDSTYWNGTDFVYFKIKGDHPLVDSTLATIDTIYFPNTFAQEVAKQDTTLPQIWGQGDTTVFTSSTYVPEISSTSDNCGYTWPVTRDSTSTYDPDSSTCENLEYVVTYIDSVADPSSNTSQRSFSVTCELDPHYWAEFPYDFQGFYWENQDPSNTGYANAENPTGIYVGETYSDVSGQNPDSTQCGHYNFNLDRTWIGQDTICNATISDVQGMYFYKPNSLTTTYFPDSITIALNDPKDPEFTGEPEYTDTLEPQFPTGYQYYDELISVTPDIDSTWHRHFTGEEYVCNTTTLDSIQFLKRNLITGINELTSGMVKIFPNPVKDYINISYSESVIIYEISITSPHGRLIPVQDHRNGIAIKLYFKDQPVGIYIMMIKTSKGDKVKKVVKM